MSQPANSSEAREVIQPPSMTKFIRPARKGESEDSILQSADKAVDTLSDNFPQWMNERVDVLRNLYGDIQKNGLTPDACENVFQAMHELRGLAGNVGFPLAGMVAANMCDVLHQIVPEKIPSELVYHHINAIIAMVHEQAKGETNEMAGKLAERLVKVSRDYVNSLPKHHRIEV